MKQEYSLEFAPDGKNFFSIKKGKIENIIKQYNSEDVVMQKQLNKFAKFKIINLANNKVIL